MLAAINGHDLACEQQMRINTRSQREHEAFITQYVNGKLILDSPMSVVFYLEKDGEKYVGKKSKYKNEGEQEYVFNVFIREVEVSWLLKEENIGCVTLLDAFSMTSQEICLIYPYEGKDFFMHFIEGDQRPLTELWDAIRGLTLGMDELARQGLIHRDLKAENVCINQNGQVKIIDPATITRAPAPPFVFAGLNRNRHPVEVLLHHDHCTPASDQWSYGILIFEIFLRTPLFTIERDVTTDGLVDFAKLELTDMDYVKTLIALYRIQRITRQPIPQKMFEEARPDIREKCLMLNEGGGYGLRDGAPYKMNKLPPILTCNHHLRLRNPQDPFHLDARLCKIVLGCLQIDPTKRLTAADCLALMDSIKKPEVDDGKE